MLGSAQVEIRKAGSSPVGHRRPRPPAGNRAGGLPARRWSSGRRASALQNPATHQGWIEVEPAGRKSSRCTRTSRLPRWFWRSWSIFFPEFRGKHRSPFGPLRNGSNPRALRGTINSELNPLGIFRSALTESVTAPKSTATPLHWLFCELMLVL